MKKILIVDDEVQILRALSRIFFETDYIVFTADSGKEGLEIMEKEEIDLIISDMRMPNMDGYEFLSIVKEKYPQTIRTILSGYTEEKTIFKAVLNSVAKMYFYKPWDNDDFINSINHLFETQDLLNSKDLLLMINSLEELPTIENKYRSVLHMIEKEQDIKSISEEIEKDLAISTTLLHVANSAIYGVKTGSINQAALYIGMQNLKNIIYTTTILNTAMASELEMRQTELIWDHALLTNKILLLIYETFLKKNIPDSAKAAGLLHNIGVVIFLKYYLTEYLKCRLRAEQEKIDLLEIEKEYFKVTHQEIGGYLIDWWGLPYPLVEVALFHHNPFEPNVMNRELVSCVHLAQSYAWKIMKRPVVKGFHSQVFEFIGINQDEFEKVLSGQSFF